MVAGMLLIVLWLGLSGCTITPLAPYDEAGVARITEISKSVLAVYGDLLAVPEDKRRDTIVTSFKPRYAEIETSMRLHLLREQARGESNKEGIRIAENLIETWVRIATQHAGDASGHLSSEQLIVERGLLERHLLSAFTAEEARKLVTKAK